MWEAGYVTGNVSSVTQSFANPLDEAARREERGVVEERCTHSTYSSVFILPSRKG